MKITQFIVGIYFSFISIQIWATDHCRIDQIAWSMDPEIHAENSLRFYDRPGNLGRYLSLELPFQAVRPVYEQIKTVLIPQLKSRGEAHITILTPVEYNTYFADHVDIKLIKSLIEEFSRQTLSFEVKSMGSGRLFNQQGRVKAETFFIIISSQDIIDLRQRLGGLLAGSARLNFKPDHFYGHITVGFTQRDLYEADGVIKDEAHSKDDRFCLVP